MPISRQDVLAASLSILDSYGLADVTMRRVASTLGVQAGALYWHFENKQSLLDALASQILADLPGLSGDDWRGALRSWAIRFHTRLRSHRSGAELVSGALALRDWENCPGYDVESYLASVGISPATARAAANGLQNMVLGHASNEEQAQLSFELGVRSTGLAPDSAQILEDGVNLLIAGIQH